MQMKWENLKRLLFFFSEPAVRDVFGNSQVTVKPFALNYVRQINKTP